MNKLTENDYPESFSKLPTVRKKELLDWIGINIIPRKTFNDRHSSYGLKHLVKLAPESNSYFTNGEFKGAMLKSGYTVKDISALNWIFNVSQKSPCFKVKP